MGKLDNTKTKSKKRQQESQQSQQDVQQYDQQDYDDEQQDDFLMNENQVDQSQMLIERINVQIQQAQNQGQKLTWVALRNLSNQQHQLNAQMDKEIQQIQNKYQALKTPIADKIADVVAGIPVQKELYKSEETNNININKSKPQQIQKFWAQVILKSSLTSFLDPSFDLSILQACTKVTSKIIDKSSQRIIFTMYFDPKKNDLFSYQQISIQIYNEKNQYEEISYITIQNPQKLQCKKEPTKESLFNTIFINNYLENRLMTQNNKNLLLTDALWGFHSIYTSAVQVYFENQQDEQEQEQQNGDNKEKQQQQEDSDDPKPSKKANIQKPQCKQQ